MPPCVVMVHYLLVGVCTHERSSKQIHQYRVEIHAGKPEGAPHERSGCQKHGSPCPRVGKSLSVDCESLRKQEGHGKHKTRHDVWLPPVKQRERPQEEGWHGQAQETARVSMNGGVRLVDDVVLNRGDQTCVDAQYDTNQGSTDASYGSDKSLADW